MSDTIDPEKAVAIRLRARLAVVERAAWFGLVHAMRTRPEETEAFIAEVDKGLADLLADAKDAV